MNENPSPDSILQEICDITNLEERAAYLDRACGDDEALRQQVESLLAAQFAAEAFLDPTVATEMEEPGEQVGDIIGHYKLLEQIGEGGFGRVWMAEQEEPVRRRVALKIIKLGMDTREVVARFEAERQALAMMEHPNIACVFDGGATETGRPYFVMELVKGVPITTYCDVNQLATRQRLELFMEVCHAVQHAHQKGVIHRDLKPSNILVTVKDDRAVPKVIDFGIAKATQAALTEKTLFTRLHQWLGTPAYMSPEQTGLGSLDVDTRSDIYSLGVLLYELLTGRPPFDPEKLLAAGYDAVMRVIREDEPPKPSTRLSTMGEEELHTIAAKRGSEPAKLNRLVRGDLDWIVMKALEKDRRRRYETANGLADDLRRHLDNEVVLARPPGTAYRMKRFIARNRMVAGFSSALLLTLLAGTITSSWLAWRARQSSREADIQREIALAEADRTTRLAVEAASARKVAEEENAGRKRQLREAARSDRLQAMELFELDRDADAFAHLARACDYDPESSLAAEAAILRLNVLSVVRQVCILRGDNPFPLEPMDRSEGIQPRSENGDDREMVEAAFTPDGRQVATRRLRADPDMVQLWDAVTGRRLRDIPVNDTNSETAEVWRKLPGLEVDGTYLSFNYPWEVAGKEDGPMPSPDGMTELAFKQEGTVLRRKATPEKGVLLAGPDYDWHFPARFAPDGLRVATANDGHRVVLHHARSGEAIALCPGHAEEVNEVRFSADAAGIVTASSDTTARVWEVADRRLLDKFEGPGKDVLRDMLHSVKFSPDDRLVIGGTPDKWLFIWDSLTGELRRGDAVLTGDGERIGASSDGTLYILRQGAEGQAGAVLVWDAVNRRELARLGERDLSVDRVVFSPDDRLLATRERNGSVRVWKVSDGRQISEVPTAMETIDMFLFSPDSRYLAVFCGLKPSLLLEVGSGRILCELPTHGVTAMEASFNPAGNLLAVSADNVDDPVTRVWECPGGRLQATLPGPEGRSVTTVEFSPDGALLATANWKSTSVQVWSVNNWRRIDFTANPPIYLMEGGVVFSPDSRLLAASGEGGRRLLFWETRSGETLANLKIPDGYLLDQAFSHDGKRMVGIWKSPSKPQASGGPVVLEVPTFDAPVPGWFSDFLRFLLQRTIDREGRRRVLTPNEWEEFRDRVSAAAASDQSRYGELARWFLIPADQRPVRPGATMTRHELADRLVTPNAGPVQLLRALAFDPANPLAHLALARFEENPKAAEFLGQWAHEHLPLRPGPELQRRIESLDSLNEK